jgi:HD-like signal output (HDOD) protein
LDNSAQVVAAWARAQEEAGVDPADSAELQRRLLQAAARLEEAARLISGDPGELPSPLAKMLGVSEEESDTDLRGHSEMISLPDFVSILANLGRDGVLEVSTKAETFTVELQRGAVVYVTGNSPHGMRLGDLLLNDGAVSADELDTALSDRLENEVLGDALLRLELIDLETLENALSTQMYHLFSRMHQMGTGFDFRFDVGRRVMPDSHARLGASKLLLEGARLMDEGAVLRRPEPDAGPDMLGLDLGASWLGDFDEDRGQLDVESFRDFVEVLFLEEKLTLPGLPASTSRLLDLTHRENLDQERILVEIGSDPALAAHVFRAACALDPSSEVVSLRGANLRLGEAGLRKLAVDLTLNGCAVSLGTWEDEIRDLWRTAVIAGEFGALLGRDHLADAELGHALALLQDIGKPVVLGAIHDIEKECNCRLAPSAALQVMEEVHQRAGAWLARKWLFAEPLVRVIENHHDCDERTGEARLEAQVANLAHDLAVGVQQAQGPKLSALAQRPMCVELGLDAELLQLLLEERAEAPRATS